MKRIYLDYAASTPVDPLVFKAMKPYFSERFGNAGSIHSYGQEAMSAIDKSREIVANAVGANFDEIIFTSSATEANNLALRGTLKAISNGLGHLDFRPRVIVSSIEHESILETCKSLEANDAAEVIYLPVNKDGMVDLKKLKEELNERTVLVSIMYANNEIGTIQPIAKISEIIRNFRKTNELTQTNELTSYPLFHVDSVQAFQYLDCDINELGVDMMTLSSHKIHGPKGAGALYIRNNKIPASPAGRQNPKSKSSSKSKGQNLSFGFSHLDLQSVEPIVFGGGQEFGLRSGTENVPAIVGFAKAVEIAVKKRDVDSNRVAKLRDELWVGIKKVFPKARINGSDISGESRLPNNLNVYMPGHRADDLIIAFDLQGVAISSGSACSSRSFESSYVIEALGYGGDRATSSVRFSLGRDTRSEDVKKVLKILHDVV